MTAKRSCARRAVHHKQLAAVARDRSVVGSLDRDAAKACGSAARPTFGEIVPGIGRDSAAFPRGHSALLAAIALACPPRMKTVLLKHCGLIRESGIAYRTGSDPPAAMLLGPNSLRATHSSNWGSESDGAAKSHLARRGSCPDPEIHAESAATDARRFAPLGPERSWEQRKSGLAAVVTAICASCLATTLGIFRC
jgi:hypothetical protein